MSQDGAEARVAGRRHDALLLALGVATLLASWLVKPEASGVRVLGWTLPRACWSDRVLDIPCAACGMTRSFGRAARLQWGAAWRASPAGLALFLVLVAQVPIRAARLRWRERAWPLPRARTVVAVVVGLMLVVWLGRLVGWVPRPGAGASTDAGISGGAATRGAGSPYLISFRSCDRGPGGSHR